jgi:hypothetical protein
MKKKGNNLWKITVDYNNAAKGRWENLKLLDENDIKEIPSEKLKLFVVDYGMLAYQEYRAACKIADKAKQLKKQVELRENILYIANKFVEAQLYALSAIQLQLKNSQRVTQQDFIKTNNIFDKVKGVPMTDATNGNTTVNTKETTTKLDTKINLMDKSDNTMALIKTVDQEISIFDKKTIQDTISNDMTKISIGLMLKADRSLVRYQAPKEVILHAKNRALKHKVAGSMAMGMGGGITIGGSVSVAACVNIYQAVAIIGVTSVGGPLTLIGGIFTLGLGIWGGVNL